MESIDDDPIFQRFTETTQACQKAIAEIDFMFVQGKGDPELYALRQRFVDNLNSCVEMDWMDVFSVEQIEALRKDGDIPKPTLRKDDFIDGEG